MSTLLDVVSPYSGELLERLATHDENQVEEALESAFQLYRDRKTWLPLHERVAVLERLAELMQEDEAALTRQAANEGGKPLKDSRVEVARAIDGVRIAIETIRAEAGDVIPVAGTQAGANRIAFTQKEPIGVVVAVSAFNHPLNLIVHQVAAAVAAGCPVIVVTRVPGTCPTPKIRKN